jgi:GMP synthase (glutamine-hydrolysing)
MPGGLPAYPCIGISGPRRESGRARGRRSARSADSAAPGWQTCAMRTLVISHQRDAGPGVFAEATDAAGHELELWHIAETAEPPADPLGYDAVITFGGAMHADQEDEHAWIAPEKALLRELLAAGVPLLGVCLGCQLLVEAAGGEARRAPEPEIGWHRVELTAEAVSDPLLAPLAPGFEAFQWHSYECVPPPEAVILARSSVCVQAFRVGESAWGIQFHAEVSAADAAQWIEEYDTDPDAVRIGVDPDALAAETAEKIGGANVLGRELCRRFLVTAHAARRSSTVG